MLKQLRAFDVCLMVFVLGLAAGKKTITGYKEYIRKRTQRLFFSVWIVLVVYFLFFM